MIDAMEHEGAITADTVLIEPTSGNTRRSPPPARSARATAWQKQIVVIVPSFAERYLSTALFEGL